MSWTIVAVSSVLALGLLWSTSLEPWPRQNAIDIGSRFEISKMLRSVLLEAWLWVGPPGFLLLLVGVAGVVATYRPMLRDEDGLDRYFFSNSVYAIGWLAHGISLLIVMPWLSLPHGTHIKPMGDFALIFLLAFVAAFLGIILSIVALLRREPDRRVKESLVLALAVMPVSIVNLVFIEIAMGLRID